MVPCNCRRGGRIRQLGGVASYHRDGLRAMAHAKQFRDRGWPGPSPVERFVLISSFCASPYLPIALSFLGFNELLQHKGVYLRIYPPTNQLVCERVLQ